MICDFLSGVVPLRLDYKIPLDPPLLKGEVKALPFLTGRYRGFLRAFGSIGVTKIKDMMERNKLLILARDPTRYAELIKKVGFTGLELVVFDSVEEYKKYVEI
ncbi:MAG: hypothetical protein L6406_08430 [Desulfobacterales bacterium]|nr:hypothetical protein [Desulfobacterales bacterium]